jgi:hypothetical protein
MQMPILLLAGSNENPSVYSGLVLAADNLPDATLVTVPGLDHALGYMLSDKMLPHITEFLAEVSQ